MSRIIAALLWALFLGQPAFADDQAMLTGIWKLAAFDIEFQDNGERRPIYKAGASGYLIFMPEKRMMTVIAANGRKPAKSDQEAAALLRTMFAYSGTYRLEGDKWITKVDVSWNEVWTGTDQVRFYKFDGPRLAVVAAWQPSRNEPGRNVRGILTWERGN
jgi:hypothetical protein